MKQRQKDCKNYAVKMRRELKGFIQIVTRNLHMVTGVKVQNFLACIIRPVIVESNACDGKVGRHKWFPYWQCECLPQNFISERVASLLRLPEAPTKPFEVEISNGRALKWCGKIENANILIQGITFPPTLYDLPLTGLEEY